MIQLGISKHVLVSYHTKSTASDDQNSYLSLHEVTPQFHLHLVAASPQHSAASSQYIPEFYVAQVHKSNFHITNRETHLFAL